MTETMAALGHGLLLTLVVTLLGFAVGFVLAVPLTAVARSENRFVRSVGGTLIDITRCVPAIVWLFLLFYGVTSENFQFSPFQAAVLGLGLFSAGHLAEILRGAMMSVGGGQADAAAALGMGRVPTMLWVVAPQALPVVVANSAGWIILLLKESAAMSVIGMTDITFFAQSEAARSDSASVFAVAAMLYILISLPFAGAALLLENRIYGKQVRVNA